MRNLYELYRALQSCNVIRLEGYRHLTSLTRETLTTMLRNRSGHVREEVNRIDVMAHLAKTTAKIENESSDFLSLKFSIDKKQTEQKINVEVYVGVPLSIAQKLLAKHKEKEKQKRKKKPRKTTATNKNNNHNRTSSVSLPKSPSLSNPIPTDYTQEIDTKDLTNLTTPIHENTIDVGSGLTPLAAEEFTGTIDKKQFLHNKTIDEDGNRIESEAQQQEEQQQEEQELEEEEVVPLSTPQKSSFDNNDNIQENENDEINNIVSVHTDTKIHKKMR